MKKLLSVLLSLSLVGSLFSCIPVSAESTEKLSLNAQYSGSAINFPGKGNITADGVNSITNNDNASNFSLSVYYYKRDSVDSAWTEDNKTSAWSRHTNNIFDGTGTYDQNFQYDFFFHNAEKTALLLDGKKRYIDIVYDLGAVYDVSQIAVVSGNSGGLITGHYKLYASKTNPKNFSEDELLIDFVNTNGQRSQTFDATQKIYARYVALRIINPIKNECAAESYVPTNDYLTQSYLCAVRLGQFQVYGECVDKMKYNSSLSGNDKTTVTFSGKGNITSVDSITHSSNAGFSVSAYKYKRDSEEAEWSELNITDSWNYYLGKIYDGVGDYHDSYSNDDFFFHNADKTALLLDGTKRYIDIIYDLGAVYDVSRISIVNGSNDGGLATGHYKLYASKTNEKNFTEDELLVDYTNNNAYRSQTFDATEKIYARYVALRIINPILNGYATGELTPSNDMLSQNYYCAVRLGQFQVYGECVDKMKYNSSLSGNDKTTVTFPGKGNITSVDSITNSSNDGFSVSAYKYKRNSEESEWSEQNITDSWKNYLAKIYDGKGEYVDSYNNDDFFFHNADKTALLLDGTKRYIDIIYDLGAVYDVSRISIVNGSTDGGLATGHYKLYASETNAKNFTEDELIVDYTNVNAYRSQTFDAIKTVHARYVALRIINPIPNGYATGELTPGNDMLSQNYYCAVRLGQFQIYGTRLPNQPTISGGSISNWTDYKKAVDLKTNLIAGKQLESAVYINTDKGVTTPTAAGIYGNKLTSTDNAYDGHTQGGNQVYFVEGNTDSGSFKVTDIIDDESRMYLQMNYQLDAPATVTDVAVLGHISKSLSPSHYKLSFANSKEELFGDTATTVDVRTNGNNYTKVKLNDGEQPTCSWVGIRVICGVSENAIGGTMSQADYYSRVSHIKVNGLWSEDSRVGDNLTVESDKEIIAVEKSAIQGRIDNAGYGAPGGSSYVTVTAPASGVDANGYYGFIGWYNGDTLVSESNEYDYYLTDSATTLTAKYTTETAYTVTYADKSGNVLYKTYVKANGTISKDDIFAASRAVPEIHGFVRRLDENGLQYWNGDDRSAITGDTVFVPTYTKSQDKYTVNVTDSAGTSVAEKMLFDQKLILSDSNAKSWSLSNKVISYETKFTVYVSGDMDITASPAEIEKTNTLTVMDTVKNIDTLSVMVHINNAENKQITEAGVIFMSGASYDAVGDTDWTEETLSGVKTVKVTLNSVSGSNYMCSLINIPKNKDVTRVAKAYVKYSDGSIDFSSATEKQVFNNSSKNPVIAYGEGGTSDPWVTYCEEDGYYYYVQNTTNGINISKSKSLFDIGNPELSVQVYSTVEDSNTEATGSWYAPEMHRINGKWYVYAAPAHSSNTSKHSMYVLELDAETPLANGENTRYKALGFMEGLNAGAPLNIDGTYWNYQDKDYFIWSDQGTLKIAELLTPTKLGTSKSISSPNYDWEKHVYSLNEGPAILEHNGKVFLSFSASDSQSDYYATGILEFNGGDPLAASSWEKWEEPILSQNRDEKIYGPGHNSFTKVLINGNWVDYIVYHAHNKSVTDGEVSSAWYARNVFVQPFYWDVDGKPVFSPVSKSIY